MVDAVGFRLSPHQRGSRLRARRAHGFAYRTPCSPKVGSYPTLRRVHVGGPAVLSPRCCRHVRGESATNRSRVLRGTRADVAARCADEQFFRFGQPQPKTRNSFGSGRSAYCARGGHARALSRRVHKVAVGHGKERLVFGNLRCLGLEERCLLSKATQQRGSDTLVTASDLLESSAAAADLHGGNP
jgi:hypothetical protein